MPRSAIPVLVLVAFGSMAALLSGGSFLETPLPGGLPAGNLLAAVALCSLALAAVGLSRAGTMLRYLSVASLVAASAWLPVSIALAGNLALNFDGFRGQLWIWLSLAVVVLVLLAAVGTSTDRVIRRGLGRPPNGR